jgi:hypothetical protein
MKMFMVKKSHLVFTLLVLAVFIFIQTPGEVHASPFGQGNFGYRVFSDLTSIQVSLGGNVSFNVTGSSFPSFSGTGSHTINVISTDAVGYSIYAYCPSSTSLVNGADSIPTSANTSAGALADNSWGYNITGSTTNFIGMTTTPTLIKSAAGEYTGGGDNTTVTYGVLTDFQKRPASYSTNVVYTVVGLND